MNRRSTITALILGAAAIGMLGASFAAEPLYSAFCRATGFGGTTQVAAEKPTEVLERVVRVSFDANVATGAPLKFHALQPYVDVKLGETMMAFYEVTNLSKEPIVGAARFNVAPYKAGPYFEKIKCFCFEEQTYKPGETVKLPVVFFVSPDMAKDDLANDVQGITLSYTYYRVDAPQASARVEDATAVN